MDPTDARAVVSPWSLSTITNIDAAVDQLKERTETRATPFQRNMLAPINARLPREMLCEIFLWLARQGWDYFETKIRSREIYDWLVVTFVCQYWRGLAQNQTELWTHIVNRHKPEEVYTSFIRRSRQRPLTAYYFATWNRSASNLDKFLREIHRIRSFEVLLRSEAQSDRVRRSLSNAPLLQTLCIRHYEAIIVEPTGEPVGPSSTPMLKKLSLDDATYPMLSTFVCPQLTWLLLHNFYAVATSLEILSRFPLLERLSITWRPGSSLAAELPTERIPLSRLRRLFMRQMDGRRICSRILDFVAVPSSATIKLRARANGQNIDDYTPFYQTLASLHEDNTIGSPHYPVMCHMLTGMREDDPRFFPDRTTLWYKESSAVSPNGFPSRPPDKDRHLEFGWRDDLNSMAALAFLAHPLSSHLLILGLSGLETAYQNPNNRNTRITVAAEASIREIRIDSFDLLDALRLSSFIPVKPIGSLESERPYFPNLEILVLSSINWRMHVDKDSKSMWRLRLLLEARRAQGRPLKKLFVHFSSNMCRKEFESLRQTDLEVLVCEYSCQFNKCNCAE